MRAILEVRTDALFVQSESSEYFHASSPAAIPLAEMYNQQRFLSLDLNYGQRVNSDMYEFLMDNGMTRDEYHFFLGNKIKQHCILGNDYYITNEHRVAAGLPAEHVGDRVRRVELHELLARLQALPLPPRRGTNWSEPSQQPTRCRGNS